MLITLAWFYTVVIQQHWCRSQGLISNITKLNSQFKIVSSIKIISHHLQHKLPTTEILVSRNIFYYITYLGIKFFFLALHPFCFFSKLFFNFFKKLFFQSLSQTTKVTKSIIDIMSWLLQCNNLTTDVSFYRLIY